MRRSRSQRRSEEIEKSEKVCVSPFPDGFGERGSWFAVKGGRRGEAVPKARLGVHRHRCRGEYMGTGVGERLMRPAYNPIWSRNNTRQWQYITRPGMQSKGSKLLW